MSDGHFNRCLLPHGQFQSGLATGKSIMRMKAVLAFKRYLKEQNSDMNESAMANAIADFEKYIEEVHS